MIVQAWKQDNATIPHCGGAVLLPRNRNGAASALKLFDDKMKLFRGLMLIFLLCLHVILVNVDDHVFNNKRGHSRYETLSVISDGIFFILPQLVAIFVSYTHDWGLVYKILGAFSMASIIKNEYFHKGIDVKERIIHACLYVLHPIILFTFYESWINNYFVTNTNFWMILLIYVGIGFKTITYQIIYWNYINDK